jgi:dTMP kinase
VRQGQGRFITVEGGEGTGKTTQCARLAARLESHGREVVHTREPGGTPAAEMLRGLLVEGEAGRWDAMAEALLHFAARRSHLEGRILPALERGAWVVCDRFADSTMAYQGYAMGLGREAVETLYRLVVGDCAPDLTIVLDLSVEAGLERARARGEGADRYERMDHGFHERLRLAFRDIARREPQRCVLVEAAADEGAVAEAVWDAVRARLEPCRNG